ncbi:DUF711 family protein [Metallosphaera tengchongensis]|uniref:DUF711 family protein n=1 Tax=Metallosphaera tengchongensis TaxID=1532350 RepID=A0A6N0NQY6_9CREN|nr:DUF711 family protein [Metallosphaera tengchongensis]QKQ99283.1 DUF711 family protein [Metallosphaera tengchongensis]
MRIRAVTVFSNSLNQDTIHQLHQKLMDIDMDLFSRRISLPPSTNVNLGRILDILPDDKSVLFSLGGLFDHDPRIVDIPDVLRSGDNIFVHILLRDNRNMDNAVKVLSKLEPDEASRFAILLNEEFLTTPYYPASSGDNFHLGFGLSLIYVKEVLGNLMEEALMEAKRKGQEIEEKIGLKFLGIDPSVSPWMEESVGHLLETKLGKKIYSPGVLSVISNMNNNIMRASINTDVNAMGFSELMIPVAEDNILKERVLEGRVTLSHLLNMSSACLAGLDMVGVNYEQGLYFNIISDLIIIQRLKKRPYGIRIIPSYGEEKIDTKNFGTVPVVKTI